MSNARVEIPNESDLRIDDTSEHKRGIPSLPIVAFVSLWLGGTLSIIGAWLHPVIPGGWLSIAGIGAIFAIPVWTLIGGFSGQRYPSTATRLFVIRPFWYAMLFAPLLAAVSLIGAAAGWFFGVADEFARWGIAIGAAILTISAIAGYIGSRHLVVKRFEAGLPRLPAEFDNLRIVQISDTHVGPHTPKKFLRRIKAAVEREKPDLIVMTGDQVDDYARDVEHFNAAFGELDAPLGVYAIAGNHDVYAGWSGVHSGLADAGFQVLVNESIAVEGEGERLWIAGTGDPAAAGWPGADSSAAPDIDKTLREVPNDEPVLALAHNPALWPALNKRGVDLTLSGHTHYGQLAIPRLNWSMASAFLDLAMHSYREGGSLLYINPGTNYWGLPFRLGTPPEVTVIDLKAGRDSASFVRI